MAPKVLVADIPEMDQTIRDCLPGNELQFVRTLPEAIAALRRGAYHLIVIGLHFDESRMFELLGFVRGLECYRDVPVICVHGTDSGLSRGVMKSIDVAVKALGGTALLDLRERSPALREHCSFLERAADAGGAGLQSLN